MNKLKATIFLCVALSGLATSVILPILAPLIRELNLSESQGGWMVSIGSVAMALMAAFWGARSDRIGRRPVILIGFAGLFLSYVAYTSVVWFGLSGALAGTGLFAALVAFRAVVGGFLPAVPAGAQALMADNTVASERSSGMAIISAASGVGLVVGPALGGILALQGLIWPLVLTTVLCFAAFLVALVALPQAPPRPQLKPDPINPLHPALWPWLAAGLITMCSIVTVQISAGFYFQDQLELSNEQTGPMLAVALTLVGVSLFMTQVVQVKFLKLSSRLMILVGVPFWIGALLILLFTVSVPSYYLAYGLMGIGAGLLLPGFMSGASLAVPPQRQGAVAGLTAAMQGIGAIIAPLTSTLLYEQNQSLPFWCIMALLAAAWLLFVFRRPAAYVAPLPVAGIETQS
jgi:MFS family permease